MPVWTGHLCTEEAVTMNMSSNLLLQCQQTWHNALTDANWVCRVYETGQDTLANRIRDVTLLTFQTLDITNMCMLSTLSQSINPPSYFHRDLLRTVQIQSPRSPVTACQNKACHQLPKKQKEACGLNVSRSHEVLLAELQAGEAYYAMSPLFSQYIDWQI